MIGNQFSMSQPESEVTTLATGHLDITSTAVTNTVQLVIDSGYQEIKSIDQITSICVSMMWPDSTIFTYSGRPVSGSYGTCTLAPFHIYRDASWGVGENTWSTDATRLSYSPSKATPDITQAKNMVLVTLNTSAITLRNYTDQWYLTAANNDGTGTADVTYNIMGYPG